MCVAPGVCMDDMRVGKHAVCVDGMISVCCAWRVRGLKGADTAIVCTASCSPQAIESSWRWLSVDASTWQQHQFRFWGRCCAQKNSIHTLFGCSFYLNSCCAGSFSGFLVTQEQKHDQSLAGS